MKQWRILGFVLGATLCATALPALADGLVRDGVGPISTGRGGTNQAFSDNAAVILDNPAGMANVAGNGLGEFGADTVISQVDYSNPINGSVSKVRPLPMPVLGYMKKSEDGRWAYGLGAFAPAGFGASYGFLQSPVGFTGPTLYRSIGGLGKILPAIAYKPTERLSLGLSVGLAISDVELDGPYVVQSGGFAGLPVIMDLQAFGVAPTGSFGLQYQLSEATVIGASYTEQTNLNLRGRVQANLFPGIASDLDLKMQMCWPRSVAVGIKHDICPHRRVSADVIWYDWAHAFDTIGLQLSNGTNLPPGLVIRDTLPLNWRDSVALRLGYELMPNDRDTWRAGYVYHGTPVPDSTLNPYLDGILNHGFSLGYSRKLPRMVFNTAYQYNFGPQHHVGTSSLIGGDFNNTNIRAQAHFAMFSLLVPF